MAYYIVYKSSVTNVSELFIACKVVCMYGGHTNEKLFFSFGYLKGRPTYPLSCDDWIVYQKVCKGRKTILFICAGVMWGAVED